jgi:hypothetical protein
VLVDGDLGSILIAPGHADMAAFRAWAAARRA